MDKTLIFQTLARALVLFTAIPIHESAHGWVAYKLGDPTAKSLGRITLNPFRHFDLIGTLCLLFVGIGWAKPVPVDVRYFKKPRLGMALTAAAGPLSNVVLAFVSMILYKIIVYAAPASVFFEYLAVICYYMLVINVMLAIFNMLPVPPFDGSRIFTFFLPEKWYFGIMRYERYIYIGVLLLVISGLLDVPLNYLRNGLINILDEATRFVDYFAARARI